MRRGETATLRGRHWSRSVAAVAVTAALTAVAVVLPAPPAGAGGNTFVDDDTSIFEPDIEAIAAAGITTGCGGRDFCPDDPVTRGQMAAFLDRALDLTASNEDRFVDDDGSLFEANIQAIATAGITTGCNPPTNDRFCPTDPVTRGQMAAFLVRALGLPDDGDDRFVDDDDVVFERGIQALAAARITRGCNPPTNDLFCPRDVVTRGQMAALLTRALHLPRPPDPTPNATEEPATLREGDRGVAVATLQRRLLELGYWLPGADGVFGTSTHHAVVALQKAAGITRDGVVGPATRRVLDQGVRPRPRSTDGDLIEIDRASQLLLVVADGQLRWVLDTSTGDAAHTTPAGWFRVTRQIDGYRRSPLGTLYRPKYFNGGIAIHGYPSVPSYPASHGCVRVTNAAMDWLWATGQAPIGRTVRVR